MSISKEQVLERLRRVKGPDLEGNIVDLGLVSEILIKSNRVYFSITVPPDKASELAQFRGGEANLEPGSEIEIGIRAPYTGSGLITIERDRVYAHTWFRATTTSSASRFRRSW